jgi:hypothetical protein
MDKSGVALDAAAPTDLRRAIAQKRLEILEQQRIAAIRENQRAAGELMPTADAERDAATGSCRQKLQAKKRWIFSNA